jgi:hypothetical protein
VPCNTEPVIFPHQKGKKKVGRMQGRKGGHRKNKEKRREKRRKGGERKKPQSFGLRMTFNFDELNKH